MGDSKVKISTRQDVDSLLRKVLQPTNSELGKRKQRATLSDEEKRQITTMTPRELLHDPDFFGNVGGKGIWDAHLEDIEELWRRRRSDEGVCLFVDIEGTSSGKTTKAAVITVLLIIELLTTIGLREKFHLLPHSKITLMCLSRSSVQTKEVTFDRIVPFFASPFFDKYFPPNFRAQDYDPVTRTFQNYPSVIRFPGGIFLTPATGDVLSTVGYDIYGGTLDEANYMEVVAKSEKSKGETSGKFDAAEIAFDEIMSRIGGRFNDGEKTHGLLVMLSNPRYKRDFLDRVVTLVSEGRQSEYPTLPPTMVRRRDAWEPRPAELISKYWFVFDMEAMKIVDKGLKSEMQTKYPQAV